MSVTTSEPLRPVFTAFVLTVALQKDDDDDGYNIVSSPIGVMCQPTKSAAVSVVVLVNGDSISK